ncbi:signal peptidase I [Granulicatella balaenopterae]|uniref:Signal peptidase I n=1 Tax=Granulicatella balaenopterae TaxID=137733 RepID=A0A1H9IW43_9LACT|nr:signal peptidase I [Granulicatella balaenopterae]SEQ79021.1 signal peptidase I [Granulicatella balaenopterae]
MEKIWEALKYFFKEYKAFLIMLLVIFGIKFWIADIYQISGESMMPTLENKERVLATKFTSIDQFDIVILNSHNKGSNNKERLYIKRVIGMPGDIISAENHHVLINGEPLEEQYLGEGSYTKDFGPITVPEGEYFVMGDNRLNSTDSRIIGCIKAEDILAETQYVLYPFSKWRSL